MPEPGNHSVTLRDELIERLEMLRRKHGEKSIASTIKFLVNKETKR